MKKVIAMIVSFMLLVSLLTSCSTSSSTSVKATDSTVTTQTTTSGNTDSTTTSSEKVKIGLSFGTLNQEHWVKSKDIMLKVGEELNAEFIVQSADDDMAKQIAQCENLITQGIDVLVLVALDTEAAAPIIQTAHEANVPVIGFVRPLQNVDVDYFFGTFLRDGGVDHAKYAVSVAPKGNYALIEGAPDDVNARYMYEGQMEVLKPYIDRGDIKIVSEQWCKNWSADEALRYIEDVMTTNDNNIQFLLTGNDAFAGAALTVLEEQKLAGKILTTGTDCDLVACQRIVAGTQGQTIFMCFPYLADLTAKAAIQLARTGDISDLTPDTLNNGLKDVPFGGRQFQYSITKDNMNIVYESGWHKVEEIYANVPQDQWPAKAIEFYNKNK